MSELSDNILTIKTVRIVPFRTLINCLKDILIETNITFQKDGMTIMSLDKSHTILVHLHLEASKFEVYNCKKEKIIIGVNMHHFCKLISQIDTDDTLTLYIEDGDYYDGNVTYLSIKFENINIKQCITQKFKLIDPELEESAYPDVKYSSIINMLASDFQKIIRNLATISETVEIKSVGDELFFKSSGLFADTVVHRKESKGAMEFGLKQDSSKIIQGNFSLKNLCYFVKCTGLCDQIEVYLENDRPLIVKYDVSSLGSLKLCLGPLPNS